MSIPETALLSKLDNPIKTTAVATLAAAVIAAAGRPVSIEEAMDVQRNIYFAAYGSEFVEPGIYQEWERTKKERLSKKFV